ncbi:MAG: glutamate formimidoyltransferase [Chloroflexi bacterium]|nr:glutamate formimidoyltransferase [Chloroflexota bacterium]
MKEFIECVANFSEGRNEVTIAALQAAVRSVREVHLLDTHRDVDHNRAVLTFVGPPEAAKWAAYRAIRVACEAIDMNQHRGVHPRIGAADVIPFVPLRAEQLPTCIEIARELAEQVGKELEIPVYCYGAAAFAARNRNLERIRVGQYEWLKENIARDADRHPDFGPARMGPAGATAIGARGPLIAFNVYLASSETDHARTIARNIRQSSGGLPCVKALGLMVGGQAQISMNLTDHRITSISAVIRAIENEARQLQVCIDRAELVGLVPLAAMMEDARRHWHLPDLSSDHILEARVGQIRETGGEDFIAE